MNYLFNLYNQLGAGPESLSLELISGLREARPAESTVHVIVPDCGAYADLESSPGLELIKLPRHHSILMKVLYRLYLEYVKLPRLVRRNGIGSVLAFGNFLLAPVKVGKTVLLHHPYLFDDALLARLPVFSRLVEGIKRLAFRLTLRNVDALVMESDYVLERFRLKWPDYEGAVHVIANPVSRRLGEVSREEVESLIETRLAVMHDCLTLLYVSRFYPHKNHEFLLPLSRALQERRVAHRIMVTVDPRIEGAARLLKQLEASGLPVFNLGELEQGELRERYASAHALIFPSRSETFGNPLVEAMRFGLPVIAPDLGYAHAVLDEAGIYYPEDVASDCAVEVQLLVQDEARYRECAMRALERSAVFPARQEWLARYLALS